MNTDEMHEWSSDAARMARIDAWWLLLLPCALGCGARPSTCGAPAPTSIEATFDTGALDTVWPGSVEVPSLAAVSLVTDPVRRGARALGFTVRKGALVNGGTRAELSWDAADRAGTTAYYAWSFRLAPDWPDIDRVKDAQGRPTWQILGQFHDQPDCALGETWDDYSGLGNSPPVAMQYFWLTRDDPSVNEVFDNGRAGQVVGLDEAALRRPLLGLLAGVPAELRAVAPIEKGRWHDVRFAVTWGSDAGGRIQWFVDDKLIITYSGRNMINAAAHFFKTGLYRNPDIDPDQSLVMDELFITHDQAAMSAYAAELANSRM